MSLLRSRRAVPLAVVTLITLVMLFSPGSTVPSGPPNIDKVTHLLMFAALAYTARFAGFGVTAVIVWAGLYAAVSEILQGLLPIHRSASIWDWAADLVGVAVGLGIFLAWQAGRGRPAPGGRGEER
ncbi:VanZ family protein [Rhodococcus maanshanensis]|uniref:VanZ like family protein n=1 Tax=Rhodococcus maanshanensis TaxID=183556 RepID=A0A1H7G6I7_9NOCA|nr:VanZ family protein [Rhodococcus maanshanensis]SEK33741.1 VanZ like family protein [Rhodococcus maanshanensis]